MRGRKFLAIAAIFVTISIFVFGGFSPKNSEIKLNISVDGEGREYIYEVGRGENARRIFLHGGSYVKYAEEEYSGDPKTFLEHLNPSIIADVEELCREYYEAPVEPRAQFSKSGFIYTEGKNGKKIDDEKILKEIVFALDGGGEIFVETEEIAPIIGEEELRLNTSLIATYTTDYSTSGEGRKRNIALACERLDLSEVPPKGMLGFNATVGPRTKQNGFFDAKIIKDGDFVSGVGGGVCQVSTTIYNAWLLAGGSAPTSATHSLTVSYVPLALDAMVSDGSDLVLYNESDYPLYLAVKCDGKKITVSVYGKPTGYTIKLRSERIKTIPAEYETVEGGSDSGEIRIIKKGRDGAVAESYRDWYKDGKLVESEKLRRSYYSPVKGLLVKN